jgi:serine carboxypeptidase-like clade I
MMFRSSSNAWLKALLQLQILILQYKQHMPSSLSFVHSAPLEDKVDDLPMYGKPPTPMYSGYLNGTDGCDTATNGECYIHYWFAGAAGSCCQESKPTILWLNGGPGSSSIIGFLQELGPLLINATDGLMKNPYSWTNVANVFVIESPVGVGYSYCTAQSADQVCINNDKYTASTARAAITDFFTRKFPELASNDFFITGESYAGVYVPTLAYEILVNSPLTNLRGLAVGDPCTDNKAQDYSMNALWYSHQYGLLDDATYDVLNNQCDIKLPPLKSHHLFANKKYRKQHVIRHIKQIQKYKIEEILSRGVNDRSDDDKCTLAYRKFLFSTSNALSQGWSNLYIDDYSLFAPVSDAEDDAMTLYMNRPDVRKALHVDKPIPGLREWPYPDSGFDYTNQYSACSGISHDDAPSMIDFYKKIVPKLSAVWIYNGDTDPCVTYEGTRTAVKRIGFNELDGGSYRPWFYNHTASSISIVQEKAVLFGPNLALYNLGAQFGGEVVNYEEGLSFITIHGSGHMVPQFRPQAALQVISKLVNGQQLLSPLLAPNATLQSLSDIEFDTLLDTWTKSARIAPYVT